ncbi:acyl-homoserine-lactone synthase [Tropicimonas sediminicola]|uniref:Acyl-homoserine-lactone synthase n=1 Tax=Tropicimonas sediminicola TaxID=1031541 RepID=A0A239KFE8_9RHOB|nr:acyl-homoserine-lactone synthase [Tropicimonas sediminicola]SNT17067.1 acyl homoserine lactone synthase [Tropicimonas sediminicola]
MHNICFDMASMHKHGNAFYEFLRIRKRLFVDTLNWDIPHNDDVEMDQYDNPLAHYSLVIRDGEVIGGARTTPVLAHWGPHTSMFQDALNGRLKDIPADLLEADFDAASSWECTRLSIAETVTTAKDRTECLDLIVDGLARTAQAHGATTLVSLSPPPLLRALRRLGHDVTRIGRIYRAEGDGRSYALLSMPALTSAQARNDKKPPLRAVS